MRGGGPTCRSTSSTATSTRSGDDDLREIIDFYKTYRAYVRAKVAAFTSDDPDLDATEKRRNRNAARNSFGLAYRYSGGTARPPVVVLLRPDGNREELPRPAICARCTDGT